MLGFSWNSLDLLETVLIFEIIVFFLLLPKIYTARFLSEALKVLSKSLMFSFCMLFYVFGIPISFWRLFSKTNSMNAKPVNFISVFLRRTIDKITLFLLESSIVFFIFWLKTEANGGKLTHWKSNWQQSCGLQCIIGSQCHKYISQTNCLLHATCIIITIKLDLGYGRRSISWDPTCYVIPDECQDYRQGPDCDLWKGLHKHSIAHNMPLTSIISNTAMYYVLVKTWAADLYLYNFKYKHCLSRENQSWSYVNHDKSLSDLQTLIRHSSSLSNFLHELLISFLSPYKHVILPYTSLSIKWDGNISSLLAGVIHVWTWF